MKYRLKKDLPDAKAGEIYRFGLNNGQNEDVLYHNNNPHGRGNYVKQSIPDFDKWFEEVKPRELYISKSFLDDFGRADKSEFFDSETRKDLVKVRVID